MFSSIKSSEKASEPKVNMWLQIIQRKNQQDKTEEPNSEKPIIHN